MSVSGRCVIAVIRTSDSSIYTQSISNFYKPPTDMSTKTKNKNNKYIYTQIIFNRSIDISFTLTL